MYSEEDIEGDHEVLFPPKTQDNVVTPQSPKRVLEVPDCAVGSVTNMVRTLNDAIAAVSQDTAQIQQAYQQLRRDNQARDKALADLTAMVKEYGASPAATQPYGPPTPKINTDVLDGDGNLRAADIGITWADNETFLSSWNKNSSASGTRTSHVHTVSGERDRWSSYSIHDRPTILTRDDRIRTGDYYCQPSGGRTSSPTSSGVTSRISSGSTNSAIQQQVA